MRDSYIYQAPLPEVESSNFTGLDILFGVGGFILGCSLVWSSYHPKPPHDVAAVSYVNTVCHLATDTANIKTLFDHEGIQYITKTLHALSQSSQDRACVALRDDMIDYNIYQWHMMPMGVRHLPRFNTMVQTLKEYNSKKD